MRRRKSLLAPQPAFTGGGTRKAWWYSEPTCIDVVLECKTPDGQTTSGIARIKRKAIEAAFAGWDAERAKTKTKKAKR